MYQTGIETVVQKKKKTGIETKKNRLVWLIGWFSIGPNPTSKNERQLTVRFVVNQSLRRQILGEEICWGGKPRKALQCHRDSRRVSLRSGFCQETAPFRVLDISLQLSISLMTR